MISASCSSEIILATAVEKAIPSSRKFSTCTGNTQVFNTRPSAAVPKIPPIRIAREAFLPVCRRSSCPVHQPVAAPRRTGKNTRKISRNTGMSWVEMEAATTATTIKNTREPTRSSSTAMGISVLVTGPDAPVPLTMESDGAGAVARAMPPKIKARYTGTSVNQKITPNTRLTTKKVPRDSVTVVTRICFPERRSLLQINSVPIIRPTVHSKILSVTLYHWASSRGWLISPRAWGPRAIPVINHPKIAGSPSLAAPFPRK